MDDYDCFELSAEANSLLDFDEQDSNDMFLDENYQKYSIDDNDKRQEAFSKK